MPRLHHLADANAFDFYDSFSLDRATPLRGSAQFLFGASNVGVLEKSNVQLAGYLACDQTSMIQNIYARTNIPLGDRAVNEAFHQFAMATTILLAVANRPQRQSPLHTLLLRGPGDRSADAVPLEEAAAYFDDLARGIWIDSAGVQPDDVEPSWQAMPDETKTSWLKVAHSAHRRLKAPQLTIVPPRQCVNVHVQSESTSLSKLLEVMPPGIAPMPLVWIHLEGFARRDVC